MYEGHLRSLLGCFGWFLRDFLRAFKGSFMAFNRVLRGFSRSLYLRVNQILQKTKRLVLSSTVLYFHKSLEVV